eukprot:5756990-Pyramimonas_sp.AAC.1
MSRHQHRRRTVSSRATGASRQYLHTCKHRAQLAHQAGVEGLGVGPRVDVALAARGGRAMNAPSEEVGEDAIQPWSARTRSADSALG